MKKLRLGLTLIELVVVVAILGVLAAMLLPKFEGLQNAVNHTTAGSSMADINRLIGTYKTSKNVYPDRWDSLTDGTAMWTAGNVGTQVKGLHAQLTDSTTGKLTLMTTALTDAQVTAFSSAGITTLLNTTPALVASTNTARAGDVFTTPATITSGTKMVIINASTTNGKKIIDRIYRFNQTPTTGVSGAIASSPSKPAGDPAAQLVVFGIGPQNGLIPNSMMEAPTYGNANASFIYNRLLAVFELTASKVTFKGTIASDGDLLDDLNVNMQTSSL